MVKKNLIEIPNFIKNKFIKSSEEKILKDIKGKEYAKIYHTSESELRDAKRQLNNVFNSLQNIPQKDIIKLIKHIPKFYLNDKEDIRHLVNLTGSSVQSYSLSLEHRKIWALNIEGFIEDVLKLDKDYKIHIGKENYSAVRIAKSEGPIIGILPDNSDEEAFHLVIQAILAKSPILLRSSSSGASSFSVIKLIEAIQKSIEDLNIDSLYPILLSIIVVNVFKQTNRNDIIKSIHIENAIYVLFGKDETMQVIKKSLEDQKYRKILMYGTGFATSIVLNGAKLDHTVNEIIESVNINNGNECVSSTVAYVDISIYNNFIDTMKRSFEFNKNLLGLINIDRKQKISEQIINLGYTSPEWLKNGEECCFDFIEANPSDIVEEVPAPIIFIKTINGFEDAIEIMKKDLENINQNKCLATSIFAIDEIVEKIILENYIPAYSVRINKGTHKVSMFLDHQGMILFNEFVFYQLIM